jgi:hypothetical protein
MGLIPSSHRRRGMILLLVLTALTFFMLIGAFMLATAMRARTAARAFATATQASSLEAVQARTLLDEALLIALRGSNATVSGTSVMTQIQESILGDKYGSVSDSCSVTLAYDPATPLLPATISGPSLNARHNGRVLTLVPDVGRGGPVSFRIVGASGNQAFLANVPPRPDCRLAAAATTYSAVINGREFTNEAHDAPIPAPSVTRNGGSFPLPTTPPPPPDPTPFDPWLARVSLVNGEVSQPYASFGYARVSASGSAVADAAQNIYGRRLDPVVDNDNDGVADGVWLSNILPNSPSPRGGEYRYRVSYLVLDLDGRINVNAAGMPDRAQGSYAGTPDNVSLGMGYGPADLDPSLVVSGTPSLPTASGTSAFTGAGTATPTDLWYRNFLSASATTTAGSGTTSQRRPPPGIPLVGRYGRDGSPGIPGDDTRGSQQTTGTSTNAARYTLTVAGTNAVADLKGQMRVYMRPPAAGQITPTLTFFTAQPGTDAADDPYEVRLDSIGPRPTVAASGAMTVNDDNPFTVADLERVLRANDADAASLPPRLAAALAGVSQASRMRITTDSWDTPALTGDAATRIGTALSGGACGTLTYPWTNANAASPDVAAGLRFNLNRPVTTPAQAQEYCKGLYTLVRAIDSSVTAEEAAQWAVNVLDFRDDDSTMTGFEYDTNLTNGWNVDGDPATTGDPDRGVVWGVERPDLLVAETAAWRETMSGTAQLFVNLIRPPWNAAVTTGSSQTLVAPVEQLAAALGDANNLAIGAGQVWQLRVSGTATSSGTTVVQFRSVSGSTTQNQFLLTGTGVTTGTSTILGGSTAVAALAPGDQCIVAPANPQFFSVTPSPRRFDVNQGGQFSPAAGMTSDTGTVWLERLADPGRAHGIDNPYVVVDVAPFQVCDYAAPGPPPPTSLEKRTRPSSGTGLTDFWRSPATWTTTTGTGVGSYSVSGTAPWFHWPNRPFVSHAELALVPANSSRDLLRNYGIPTSSLVSGASTLSRLLLDATYVPSRFAGCGITVTSGTMAACGLDRLAANHFSTWREPGRVNVNTIPPGTTGLVDTDSLVWATLLSGTSLSLAGGGTVTVNPFVSTGAAAATPATSTAQLLSLSGAAGQAMARELSGTAGLRDKNPFFAYAAAIRLANTATIRSNVFAVWITLETTDSADGSTTYHRLFAIVDRSIPVGFRQGEDLNVRDTIRLRRFLE